MTGTIIVIPYGSDNYAFLILCETDKKFSILIDAGSAIEITKALDAHPSYPCEAVLITHFDDDHVNGLSDILRHTGFPAVYGHRRKPWNIKNYVPVSAETSFDTHGLSIRVFECYSHSNDHLAFYVRDALFCGDIIFSAGCGRFFNGGGADLLPFATMLLSLPDSTKLYFGHEYTLKNLSFASDMEPNNPDIREYAKAIRAQSPKICTVPSSLALEKRVNPFLRYNEPAIATHPECRKLDDPAQRIDKLRQIRNRY